MLFAGFAAYQGHLSLIGVIVAGVAGDVVGAGIAYAIGRRGLHEVLNELPGPFHLSDTELERANRWFDQFGAPVMAVSRVLPVVRAAFPYGAGTAEMPLVRCLFFCALGSIVWIGGLGLLGHAVGSQWPTWRHHLEYVDYVGAAVIVAAVVWVVYRWARTRRAHV
jgi:membrane protein DedA with SNARE-associated domain